MQSTSNWRVLSLSMILMACGATDEGGDTSGTSTTDDTGTLSTTVTGTTTPENVSASLSGVITDSAGADLPETDIRFCRGSACRVFKTEGNGDYNFNSVAVDAWFSLENKIGAARVVITTTGGQTFEKELEVAYGHPRNPITEVDFKTKFFDCAATSVHPPPVENVAAAYDLGNRLETVPDIGELVRLLS